MRIANKKIAAIAWAVFLFFLSASAKMVVEVWYKRGMFKIRRPLNASMGPRGV
jgi:hypothetical protein